MDIAFIVDSSSSVTGSNFYEVINYIADMLENADVDSGHIRAALITFGKSIQLRFSFDDGSYTNLDELTEIILETDYDMGESMISQAIGQAQQTFGNSERTEARKVILVITDGAHDLSSGHMLHAITIAQTHNISIFIIAVGLSDPRALDVLTYEFDHSLHVVNIPDYNALDNNPFVSCGGSAGMYKQTRDNDFIIFERQSLNPQIQT